MCFQLVQQPTAAYSPGPVASQAGAKQGKQRDGATTTRRRTGSEDSKTRAQLIEVTERLMVSEGYAAVTSRRVALEAGVTAPLVHYYFPSLDDLFVAVLQRRAEQQLTRQARMLAADEPLRALWTFNTDRKSAVFLTEFMGLANHRKSIRREIAAYAERFREIELAAIEQAVADGRIDLGGFSPGGDPGPALDELPRAGQRRGDRDARRSRGGACPRRAAPHARAEAKGRP